MRSLSELFSNFHQVAYVTGDLDNAISSFDSVMELNWEKAHANAVGTVVDDKAYDTWLINYAVADAGTTNFEIFQPASEGPLALYGPAIRPGTPYTLHHLAFYIHDFDEASAILQSHGRTWKMRGIAGQLRYGYIDMTSDLGYYVELLEYGAPKTEVVAPTS
jgi:hypothetical protein